WMFMKSKYRIRITGKNCDYFFHILLQKGISIYSFSKNDSDIEMLISGEDYSKIKKIKTSYQIDTIDVYGYPKVRNFIKKYSFFLISFFICFFLLILSSQFLFQVSVLTSDQEMEKMILEDLKVRGVSPFHFQKSYTDRQKIISSILEEERDSIEWMEIERIGTKYQIHVVERITNKIDTKCESQNIVAKKDAFVVRIDAVEGEVSTAINRYVHKGDLLISGDIHNKEDLMKRRCAIGNVMGEVWYQVTVEVPKHYYEENVTGNIERRIGFDFFSIQTKSHFKTYQRREYPILENPILPMKFYYAEYLETDVVDRIYTYENIDSYGI
ncbi:MAG: sporulation protein YqfD, partial [Bacilli bacterium]|nr:sporulation protein YqfD [Bacilli bacterium]